MRKYTTRQYSPCQAAERKHDRSARLYHKVCLSNFYRKASAKQLEGHYTHEERKLDDIEFGQVVTFIEETVTNATLEIPVFKLSDLVKLYNAQQKELGVHLETRIPSTRFKLRLLSQFQDMSAYNDKKEVYLLSTVTQEKLSQLLLQPTMMIMATSLLKKIPY